MIGQMDIPWWAVAVAPLISAAVGAYLGGYLKKKGENLATHEDIARKSDGRAAASVASKPEA